MHTRLQHPTQHSNTVSTFLVVHTHSRCVCCTRTNSVLHTHHSVLHKHQQPTLCDLSYKHHHQPINTAHSQITNV